MPHLPFDIVIIIIIYFGGGGDRGMACNCGGCNSYKASSPSVYEEGKPTKTSKQANSSSISSKSMLVVASLIFVFSLCLGAPLPSASLPILLSNTTALDTEITGE
jgi:hypothetical protein